MSPSGHVGFKVVKGWPSGLVAGEVMGNTISVPRDLGQDWRPASGSRQPEEQRIAHET